MNGPGAYFFAFLKDFFIPRFFYGTIKDNQMTFSRIFFIMYSEVCTRPCSIDFFYGMKKF